MPNIIIKILFLLWSESFDQKCMNKNIKMTSYPCNIPSVQDHGSGLYAAVSLCTISLVCQNGWELHTCWRRMVPSQSTQNCYCVSLFTLLSVSVVVLLCWICYCRYRCFCGSSKYKSKKVRKKYKHSSIVPCYLCPL